MRKRFLHQVEEQWAKERTLISPIPMPISPLYWTFTCTPLGALKPCMTLPAHYSTLRLLKAHHRETVERFAGGDVLLLQLGNNCISAISTNTKPNWIPDTHNDADVDVQHPLKQLHDLWAWGRDTATIEGLTFGVLEAQDEAFLPTLQPIHHKLHICAFQNPNDEIENRNL